MDDDRALWTMRSHSLLAPPGLVGWIVEDGDIIGPLPILLISVVDQAVSVELDVEWDHTGQWRKPQERPDSILDYGAIESELGREFAGEREVTFYVLSGWEEPWVTEGNLAWSEHSAALKAEDQKAAIARAKAKEKPLE